MWKMDFFYVILQPHQLSELLLLPGTEKRWIVEGVRRAKPYKRPTPKHLAVWESSDELGDLVMHLCPLPFLCRDEDGVGSTGQGKREIGHQRAVERLGMKEWEEGKEASRWGFLSDVRVGRPTKLFLPGKSYFQIPVWKSLLKIPGWSGSQWAPEAGQGLYVSGLLHLFVWFFFNQNALPTFIPNSPAALLLPSKPLQIYTTAYLFSKIMAYKHCVPDLHEAVTGVQRAWSPNTSCC